MRFCCALFVLLTGCVHGEARSLGSGGAGGEGGAGGASVSSSSTSSSGNGGGTNPTKCGDGALDVVSEQCDDGNRVAQDGCDSTCRVECSTGWLDDTTHHCYRLMTTSASWQDARTACTMLGPGYDLAAVSSKIENDFLLPQFPVDALLTRIWIGGNDQMTRGTFAWTNGEPWGYTDWDMNEPSNSNGVENCVEYWDVFGSYKWNDVECGLTLATGFLCELTPAGT